MALHQSNDPILDKRIAEIEEAIGINVLRSASVKPANRWELWHGKPVIIRVTNVGQARAAVGANVGTGDHQAKNNPINRAT
jgi:hypothetical protein